VAYPDKSGGSADCSNDAIAALPMLARGTALASIGALCSPAIAAA